MYNWIDSYFTFFDTSFTSKQIHLGLHVHVTKALKGHGDFQINAKGTNYQSMGTNYQSLGTNY